jgi:hypothetical protein
VTDPRALLDRGVSSGIISPAQRDALLGLTVLDVPPEREAARRALDGVTIAYALGAALVVFALGWFLADRWETLGPAGVLAVASGYAALLALVADRLARARFSVAAGTAWALATLTAALVAWSLLRLTGEWPGDPATNPLFRYEPFMATRRLVVEQSVLLACLLGVRFLPTDRVRRTPLAIPLAAAAGATLADAATLLGVAASGAEVITWMRGWDWTAAGAALFGIAFAVDVRQQVPGDRRREDFAGWLYGAACLVFQAGLLVAFNVADAARHALPLVALAQLAAAARLERRTLLVAGLVNAVWYLGYLAFDVFREVLSFPLLLAAFGVALLVVTVVVQRRFPALLRRRTGPGTRPSLPGGALAAWAPLGIALVLLPLSASRARRRAADIDRRQRVEAAQVRRRGGRPPGRPVRPSSPQSHR